MRRVATFVLALAVLAAGGGPVRAHVGVEELGHALDAEVARHPGDGELHLQRASGPKYSDATLSRRGFKKIKVRFGAGSAQIEAKASGPGAAVPTLPATFPVTAQVANLDSGTCWQSVFTTPRKNDARAVIAAVP